MEEKFREFYELVFDEKPPDWLVDAWLRLHSEHEGPTSSTNRTDKPRKGHEISRAILDEAWLWKLPDDPFDPTSWYRLGDERAKRRAELGLEDKITEIKVESAES